MELRDKDGLTEAEFLAQYNPKDYPRPSFTADIVLFACDADNELQVLMVRRGGHPYLGCWALPGGFVEQGEDADAAAARELAEETCVEGQTIEQLGLYSAPGRDPRAWTVSAAYVALLADAVSAHAADDATEACWCPMQVRCREDGVFEMEIHAGGDELHSVFEKMPKQHMPARAHVLGSDGFAFDHAQIIADAWFAVRG